MLTELDKKIIALIQGDLPVTKRPFQAIAQQLAIDEDTVLATLKKLRKQGVIRRFGATLRHQKSGFAANAMVAWRVEEARIDAVGRQMAAYRHVSHCYRRNPMADWPYNLYTMIHAGDEETCFKLARDMARATQVETYKLLFSREELKKTSMQYFTP